MDHEVAEVEAEVRSGRVCPNPSVPEAETEAAEGPNQDQFWSIEGQQWLTAKQLGKARWTCANLSGPGPHGLVPRSTNSEVLDMTGHSDLVRVLSTAWEL